MPLSTAQRNKNETNALTTTLAWLQGSALRHHSRTRQAGPRCLREQTTYIKDEFRLFCCWPLISHRRQEANPIRKNDNQITPIYWHSGTPQLMRISPEHFSHFFASKQMQTELNGVDFCGSMIFHWLNTLIQRFETHIKRKYHTRFLAQNDWRSTAAIYTKN